MYASTSKRFFVIVICFALLICFPSTAIAGSLTVPGNSVSAGGFYGTIESYAHWANGTMTTSSTLRLNTEAAVGGIRVSNTMTRGIYSMNDVRQTKQVVNGVRTKTLTCAQSYVIKPGDQQYGWSTLQSSGSAWLNVNGGISVYMGTASVGNSRSGSLVEALDTPFVYDEGGKYLRVTGVNGISGYVETSELNRLMDIEKSDDALQYARDHLGLNYLDVYDSSKKVVVDAYPLEIAIAE